MKKNVILAFIMLVGFFCEMSSQNFSELDYKAAFTTSIVRYFGWDKSVIQSDTDFVIGIVKNRALFNKVYQSANNKQYGYQKIVVKEFNNVNNITDCHVLFISSLVNFSKYHNIIHNIIGKNTLIITEADGMIKYGSSINFIIIDNILKFEINKKNIINSNIQLNGKLERLTNSIIVN
jgi:hypothetical protein